MMQLPTVATKLRRDFALDILRGIAIWLVLLRHMPYDASGSLFSFPRLSLWLKTMGWSGVDLFFVLSGFLISGLLFREFRRTGRLNVWRFWLRRGMKIWPSYFVIYGTAVIGWAALSYIRGDHERMAQTLRNAVPNLLFVQNYWLGTEWPHSWSLAIEEQFYIALPIILIIGVRMTGKRDFRWLGRFMAALLVVILALRMGSFLSGAPWQHRYYFTHLRADALLMGVILGYLKWFDPETFHGLAGRWKLLLFLVPAGVLVAVILPLEEVPFTSTAGFTVVYLSFGICVLLAGAFPTFGLQGPLLLRWLCRFLAFSGVYSYTIYLVHAVVDSFFQYGVFLHYLERLPGIVLRIGFLVCSVGGGVMASHLIERPFLRMRERWLPS